jgi:hypothetical protein
MLISLLVNGIRQRVSFCSGTTTVQLDYDGGRSVGTRHEVCPFIVQSIYELLGVNPEQIATKVFLLEFS